MHYLFINVYLSITREVKLLGKVCTFFFYFYTHIHVESVQFSRSVMSDSLWPHGLKHTRPPCPSPTPRVHPSLCPLSWWCHPTISSSVDPFSSCLQCFPASGSFQINIIHTDFLKGFLKERISLDKGGNTERFILCMSAVFKFITTSMNFFHMS